MVKFRDRLLDIVEDYATDRIDVSAMMAEFDLVIADITDSVEALARVGVAAPPAQDANYRPWKPTHDSFIDIRVEIQKLGSRIAAIERQSPKLTTYPHYWQNR